MTPTSIGRYQIKKELARGGMAVVYLANDPMFDREVAVKVLPREALQDEQFRMRFEREAKYIAAVEHAAIVPVYDFGEQEGQPYLVMRYMPGGSLRERLQQGPLSLPETAMILQRIALALDHAHRRGIIHRDMKPGNILFDEAGEAYLTDFGIAKRMISTITITGNLILGTPAYMSPEQARGDPDINSRTDIYALGAILFEMLTGHVPYEADTPTGQMLRHITDPVPNILQVRKDLPVESQEVIERAMAKSPERRYTAASELFQAVQKLCQPKKTATLPAHPYPDGSKGTMIQSGKQKESAREPSTQRKSRLWLAAIPVLLIVLAGMCFGGGALLSRVLQAVLGRGTAVVTPTYESPLAQGITPSPVQVGFASLLEVQGGDLYTGGDETNPTPVSAGAVLPAGAATRLWTRQGFARLKLSSEAVVCLGQETAVWLVHATGAGSNAENTLLKIEKGSLLVDSTAVLIQANGDRFQVEGGYSILGLTYDARRGRFLVDCISGKCTIDTQDSSDPHLVPVNQRGGFDGGKLIEIQPAEQEAWRTLCGSAIAWPTLASPGLATTAVPSSTLTLAVPSSTQYVVVSSLTPTPTPSPTRVSIIPTNTKRPPTKVPVKATPTRPPATKPPTKPPN